MGAELLLGLFIQYGYWFVFAGILLDNAGLPIPGELVLIAFGALARTGHVDLGIGLLVAIAAAMSGDSAAYWMGRLGGERLLGTYCRVTLGSGKCVTRATAFYRLHGSAAVVLGRFVIGVRAFLFPLAGSARMPYSRFLLFDGIGAMIWVGAFILTGYGVGERVEAVYGEYRTGALIVAGAFGAALAVYLVMKLYRRWRRGPGSFRGRTAAALRTPLLALEERLWRAAGGLLNREVPGYELKAFNDMPRLYHVIRKGDVVLLEGRLRISQFIKFATQSPWTHSAVYVGDELLRRGGRLREQAEIKFGEHADRLIVEALTGEGVIAASLEKYQAHNMRVCRPYGIDPADLARVIEYVLADLGKQYDDRNLLDLALILLSPIDFGFLKTRTGQTCLGGCTDRQVICSGMIAKAFQQVGYPVRPDITLGGPHGASVGSAVVRHYSQILPRDFDLSPNFEVINVNAADSAVARTVNLAGEHVSLAVTSPASLQGARERPG